MKFHFPHFPREKPDSTRIPRYCTRRRPRLYSAFSVWTGVIYNHGPVYERCGLNIRINEEEESFKDFVRRLAEMSMFAESHGRRCV